jgi:uncharacterized protein
MQKSLSSSVKVFYPDYSLTKLLELIQERLRDLGKALPLKRVALFGSWAVGRQTAFSDMDLLVIYDDPPREDAYKFLRQHLKLRGLEPQVYSEQGADKLKATIERMTKDGIVLFPEPTIPNLQNSQTKNI